MPCSSPLSSLQARKPLETLTVCQLKRAPHSCVLTFICVLRSLKYLLTLESKREKKMLFSVLRQKFGDGGVHWRQAAWEAVESLKKALKYSALWWESSSLFYLITDFTIWSYFQDTRLESLRLSLLKWLVPKCFWSWWEFAFEGTSFRECYFSYIRKRGKY